MKHALFVVAVLVSARTAYAECPTTPAAADAGPGRTPAPVPHDQFVEAMRMWPAAGAPCPD